MIQENPLPLTINCDWTRMRKIYSKLIDNYHNGFFDNQTWVPNAKYMACDIGHHGRLAVGDTVTPDIWFAWSGPLVEAIIPWAQSFKKLTKDAGIFLQNFAFHCHSGDIFRHRDSKDGADMRYQDRQCNLNFIVSSDNQSKSYFEQKDGIHYYVGKNNHAYLIDSSVPHWVENSHHREIFQIRFHSTYAEVKEFLQSRSLTLA